MQENPFGALANFFASGIEVVQSLALDGTSEIYTVPSDGYYAVEAVNTSISGNCNAWIIFSSHYVGASQGTPGSYTRACTGFIPFKAGAQIEVRGQATSYVSLLRLI